MAIKALEQAQQEMKKHPDKPPLQLQLIGDGPDRVLLEEMVKKRGLNKWITFSGWLQPPEIAKIMQNSDILLHPARWEAYGVVVMEAMALAKPVLGSDACGAVMDRVIPGESGFIHPVDDIDRLTRHMVQLAIDPLLYHHMCAGARRMAEKWPVQRGVNTILNIVLENSNPSEQNHGY